MTPSKVMPSEEQDAAWEVVRAVFGQDLALPPFLVGRGLVNQVYGAQVGGRTVVVRFCGGEAAFLEHQKEVWCIRRAAAVGVPGPTVQAVGTLDGTSYMIQTFLEGIKGEEVPSLWPHIWRELGRYARLTHAVAAQGFGGQLADAEQGLFSNAHTPTWVDFVGYNIASLTTNDALLGLGVSTPPTSAQSSSPSSSRSIPMRFASACVTAT